MKYIATLLSLLLLSIASISCSDNKDSNDIIVATSADNPPFEFIQDGKIVGLDIDVINAIGNELGKNIIIKNLDFPGLFPALNNGNADIIIAALSATPERLKHYKFSTIYSKSSIAALVKDPKIRTIEDLANKKICTQLGTTWEKVAHHIASQFPGTVVKTLSNNLIIVEELRNNNIDAFITEAAQVDVFIKNHQELQKFILPDDYSSSFAIAAPNDSDIIDDINKAIEKLQANGVLRAIQTRWIQINER